MLILDKEYGCTCMRSVMHIYLKKYNLVLHCLILDIPSVYHNRFCLYTGHFLDPRPVIRHTGVHRRVVDVTYLSPWRGTGQHPLASHFTRQRAPTVTVADATLAMFADTDVIVTDLLFSMHVCTILFRVNIHMQLLKIHFLEWDEYQSWNATHKGP